MTDIAYCWKSGEIEFAEENEEFELPEGTIAFARGNFEDLENRLFLRARHGYDGTYLVPGIPEEDDDGNAVDALDQWVNWAFPDWPIVNGVRTQLVRDPLDLHDDLSAAERDVLTERKRQVFLKGWSSEHDDDAHLDDEMACAAAAYVLHDTIHRSASVTMRPWPIKFGDRRDNLVKAAALIIAEIERLDRASDRGSGS